MAGPGDSRHERSGRNGVRRHHRLHDLSGNRARSKLLRTRMTARGGTDGGARGSKDHGERDHKHAIRSQKNVFGFLGHWQLTLSDFVSLLRLVVNSEWSPPPI
jgi:hypothetical protein